MFIYTKQCTQQNLEKYTLNFKWDDYVTTTINLRAFVSERIKFVHKPKINRSVCLCHAVGISSDI